ncbi:MAG: nucleotidyltransferase domain-containing protein [Nitrospiraceae bacterium]
MAEKPFAAPAIQDEIREIVHRIVSRFNPEKIILFGSHARGNAGPDSDVDLLIVMDVIGSKRQTATAIDMALLGIDLPVDVIVLKPEEVERNRHMMGTIVYPALREGKVLYERRA